MRLLLPAAPEVPNVLFYEINISEEPASLAITGFDGRHRAVAQADVRPDGEFGLNDRKDPRRQLLQSTDGDVGELMAHPRVAPALE